MKHREEIIKMYESKLTVGKIKYKFKRYKYSTEDILKVLVCYDITYQNNCLILPSKLNYVNRTFQKAQPVG